MEPLAKYSIQKQNLLVCRSWYNAYKYVSWFIVDPEYVDWINKNSEVLFIGKYKRFKHRAQYLSDKGVKIYIKSSSLDIPNIFSGMEIRIKECGSIKNRRIDAEILVINGENVINIINSTIIVDRIEIYGSLYIENSVINAKEVIFNSNKQRYIGKNNCAITDSTIHSISMRIAGSNMYICDSFISADEDIHIRSVYIVEFDNNEVIANTFRLDGHINDVSNSSIYADTFISRFLHYVQNTIESIKGLKKVICVGEDYPHYNNIEGVEFHISAE